MLVSNSNASTRRSCHDGPLVCRSSALGGTTMDRLHRQTLGDTLRRTARRLPHKTALVFRTRTWTYAALDADCNRVAHGLAGLGIVKGDRVAILSRNSAEFVLIRFALARLGAVLV